MRDVLTVLRKELLELLGDRSARRGGLLQAGVVIGLCGVFLPATKPALLADPVAGTMLYVVFPAMLAAFVAADAFAGERERRTLETLLATPVSDLAVFGGKVLTATLFSWTVVLACLCASTVVGAFRGTALPPGRVAFLALGGLSAALLTAAIGTLVSLKMETARSAQQVSGLLMMALAFGSGELLEHLPGSIGSTRLFLLDGVLVLVAGAVLALASGFFGRDRLFDRR